jgi:O-antigen ligase
MGAFLNLTILNNQTGTTAKMSLDLFAYIFIFATAFTLEANINQKSINPWQLLKGFIILSSIILTILLLISFYTPSLLGLALMYDETSFAPLVTNVHQITMFYIILPFLCIGILMKEYEIYPEQNSIFKTILLLTLFCTTIYMALTAQATKAVVGFWLGVACLFLFYFISKSGIILRSLIIYSLIICIVFIFYYFDLLRIFSDFFVDADGIDGARAHLYGGALNLISESPILGRGPGGHIWKGELYWDVHQTFLTAFIQAGIIGFVSLMLLIYRFARDILNESIFLASMAPLAIYALGGDILRRLPVWILLILIMYAVRHVRLESYKKIDNTPRQMTTFNT